MAKNQDAPDEPERIMGQNENADPTEAPAFQKVVGYFLRTPAKPHECGETPAHDAQGS